MNEYCETYKKDHRLLDRKYYTTSIAIYSVLLQFSMAHNEIFTNQTVTAIVPYNPITIFMGRDELCVIKRLDSNFGKVVHSLGPIVRACITNRYNVGRFFLPFRICPVWLHSMSILTSHFSVTLLHLQVNDRSVLSCLGSSKFSGLDGIPVIGFKHFPS